MSLKGFSIMLTKQEFINEVFTIARKNGYVIEKNARNGRDQIDFGNKKLHEGHLEHLYPKILMSGSNVSGLIEKVAPGRPCTHKPMKEILSQIS